MTYFLAFLSAFILAVILTPLIIGFAKRWKILDLPDQKRKTHSKPTPLLGGIAVYISFAVVVLVLSLGADKLFGGYMLPKHIFGFLAGGLILMIGGWLDDKYKLSPIKQIIWPILASVVIIFSGIGIDYIRNPFGDPLILDSWQIKLFIFNGVPYYFTVWSDLFTLLWLLGMSYTTKILDGLDGLVAGITVISSGVLFFLSISQTVAQPETALLAITLAGAALGFLIFNFNPARIFLGEGGSVWLGFALGVLAIISGGKVATALLLLGIPILDVLSVIVQRLLSRRSIARGDKAHLHFRLLDFGLTARQTVLLLYLITAVFGTLALMLPTQEKLWALITLGLLMAGFVALVFRRQSLHKKRNL